MKKTIKIFSLLIVIACFFSCDPNQDLGFSPQEELGWIQFVEGEPAISSRQMDQEIIRVGVNIQVPTTSSDLTINYNLVSVSGMDPNAAFSNSGSIVSPAGETSYSGPDNNTGLEYAFLPTINFDVSEISGLLTEPMIFDVVLSGTSSGTITVGLAGEDFPITQRITIWNVNHFAGTYNVSEVFTGGPNAGFGLSDFFGESYEVVLSLVPGENGKYLVTDNLDFYFFFDTAELTLLENGEVAMDDGNGAGFPVVALFRVFEYTSSSYDGNPFEIICSGPLDVFGPYQFVLTKQ